jgi:histidine ammonia-lyase
MRVSVGSRSDLTLSAYRHVAWHGAAVDVTPSALSRIAETRAAFVSLIERGSVTIYGVTSGVGDRAGQTLTREEQALQASVPTDRGVSFGELFPDRVARGIVFARLANFVEGHAAVRPIIAEAVAGLLDGRRLPRVPSQGNGGSGEILALGHLFRPIRESVAFEAKEGLALVNGSPCAAALLADATLAARGRLAVAYDAFSLAVEAFRAPLEAYDESLAELWGDESEAAALRALNARLDGAGGERATSQAPVSFRILPRVLGQAERALAAAERGASSSLASVTDNPVFLMPSDSHPHGRVISTGGFHNGAAPQLLNGLSAAMADLCRLAERHVEQLWVGPGKRQPQVVEHLLSLFLMVTVGWCEEAANAADPTLLPRSGGGQNDVGAPSFLAWRRADAVGRALDACLALLLAASAQILLAEQRPPAPPLRSRFQEVAEICPRAQHPHGERISELAHALTETIYSSDVGSTAP